jgi:hypothetical protein
MENKKDIILAKKQKTVNHKRRKQLSDAQESAKKIRESLSGREHSDSVELLREDRQR